VDVDMDKSVFILEREKWNAKDSTPRNFFERSVSYQFALC